MTMFSFKLLLLDWLRLMKAQRGENPLNIIKDICLDNYRYF